MSTVFGRWILFTVFSISLSGLDLLLNAQPSGVNADFQPGRAWYDTHGNPCVGEDAELTFHAQGTYIVPVVGYPDAFIFMAGRWNPGNPIDGRYVWLPIEFEKERVILKWQDSWNLDFFRNNELVSDSH